MMTRSWQRVLRMTGYAVLACSLPAALACFVSYRQDQDFLGEMARRIVAGETTPAARVLALSNSIHRDQATHKNGSFFAVRRWGPTSRQVFVHGGDCADKSRLLCALLRELDISATPVMCFDPQTGLPTHTIVETDLGDGSRMIVDPTYDLYFPKPNAAGFYDLLDLRRDPDILANRIAELCASAPPAREADVYYMRASTPYHHVSTINWDQNAFSRWTRDRLLPLFGDRVYRFSRPAILEEPKLLATVTLLTPGVLVILLMGCKAAMRLARRRWRRLRNDRISAVALNGTYSGRGLSGAEVVSDGS